LVGPRSGFIEEEGTVTETEIIALARGLDGVVVLIATAESGAPEVAWGDSFVYYDPDGSEANRKMPFATVVCSDYPGFDTESQLDREGVFRLNLAVGRAEYERLLGHPPSASGQRHSDYDYAELDALTPHPVYAEQGWVSIVSPGPRTADQARRLLADAHDLARTRYQRRHQGEVGGTAEGG
jgi:hypothetical protein